MLHQQRVLALMAKPSDHLVLMFSYVARELRVCRAAKTRKRLLVQMRLIVEQANSVTKGSRER
jgi:hypothetical protein